MLLETWRKRRKILKRAVPREHVSASVGMLPDGFEVKFGAKSFFVKTGRAPRSDPPAFDFAIFGLAAVSMSNNIEITLESPVSSSAASQLTRIKNAFDTWTYPNLAPLRLNLAQVVADPEIAARSALGICLSGGVDSTAAAIEALDHHGLTHGMLIAGADYPGMDHPGFVELHRKVAQQAEILGIDLLVTETNIRTCGFQWEMLFSLNLAMCLHAQSDLLGAGAIGADFAEIQDLVLHPWGTSHALTDTFGTVSMPILSLNRRLGRTQKLRSIIESAPDLVEHLSVCWEDASQGGNCGTCLKCQRTKLNLIAAIGEIPDIFSQNPLLTDFVRSLKVPTRFSGVRTELAQIGDIYHNLPEGEIRDLIGAHFVKLKLAYAARMPIP